MKNLSGKALLPGTIYTEEVAYCKSAASYYAHKLLSKWKGLLVPMETVQLMWRNWLHTWKIFESFRSKDFFRPSLDERSTHVKYRGFVEVKTLFVDNTDIVNVQVFLQKLGTQLRQWRQEIFLADIDYWQYIVTTENAVITIDKPTRAAECSCSVQARNINLRAAT